MKTLQEMEKIVVKEKGILYSIFFMQMMGHVEKNSKNLGINADMTFIPMKFYYRIASWLFHLNKKDANMLLGEFQDMKIIIVQRHGKNKGIKVQVVIK